MSVYGDLREIGAETEEQTYARLDAMAEELKRMSLTRAALTAETSEYRLRKWIHARGYREDFGLRKPLPSWYFSLGTQRRFNG